MVRLESLSRYSFVHWWNTKLKCAHDYVEAFTLDLNRHLEVNIDTLNPNSYINIAQIEGKKEAKRRSNRITIC